MQSDGTYSRIAPKDEDHKIDVQEWLMNRSYKKS
jgi:hypothetical protein